MSITPGTWSFWRSGNVIEVKTSASEMAVVPWTAFDDGARALSQHADNARLIAAAPKMYDALKTIAEGPNDAISQVKWRGIARAAIAKATK